MKIRRSTFKANGSSVTRVASRRMTLYVPDEVPIEVLQLWLTRLRVDLPRRLSTLRYVRRRDTRRKRVPTCRFNRRRIRRRRVHVPLRFWRHEAIR
ncbi:hypothetical protein R69749_06506 [Paraburkholderia domus]|nr:hypothetical protein R69749_06506 [Paraburkholderia domus]